MNLDLKEGNSEDKRLGTCRTKEDSLWMLGCLYSNVIFFQRLGFPSLGGRRYQDQVVGS